MEGEKLVRVSDCGEITIPEEIREGLCIETPGHAKFSHTEDGALVIESVHSVADLRGTLSGLTDEDGRSATERLRAERKRDSADRNQD